MFGHVTIVFLVGKIKGKRGLGRLTRYLDLVWEKDYGVM